jgi:bifunctional DNA-binding transcriptional regulator/antitoxin component of YhaV-PrlF toxin-antitoxin module
MGEWGRKHGLAAEYESVSVGESGFVDKVKGRRASVLGYWGIGFRMSDQCYSEHDLDATRIVGKFQVTVPPEIREIFDLQQGDLLEWSFDEATSEIRITAKRAQLITPRVLELAEKSKAAQDRAKAAPRAATSC